jgi:hypothetical protein
MLSENPFFLSRCSKPLSGFVDIILSRSRFSAARVVGSLLESHFITEARRNSVGYLSSRDFGPGKSL